MVVGDRKKLRRYCTLVYYDAIEAYTDHRVKEPTTPIGITIGTPHCEICAGLLDIVTKWYYHLEGISQIGIDDDEMPIWFAPA